MFQNLITVTTKPPTPVVEVFDDSLELSNLPEQFSISLWYPYIEAVKGVVLVSGYSDTITEKTGAFLTIISTKGGEVSFRSTRVPSKATTIGMNRDHCNVILTRSKDQWNVYTPTGTIEQNINVPRVTELLVPKQSRITYWDFVLEEKQRLTEQRWGARNAPLCYQSPVNEDLITITEA